MNQPEMPEMSISPPSRSEISKRSPLETLNIPDTAFDQALKLCVGMQFDHWNHAYLVLLAYGQKVGFVWRIQDKYPDKNGEYTSMYLNVDMLGNFSQKKQHLTLQNNVTENQLRQIAHVLSTCAGHLNHQDQLLLR